MKNFSRKDFEKTMRVTKKHLDSFIDPIHYDCAYSHNTCRLYKNPRQSTLHQRTGWDLANPTVLHEGYIDTHVIYANEIIDKCILRSRIDIKSVFFKNSSIIFVFKKNGILPSFLLQFHRISERSLKFIRGRPRSGSFLLLFFFKSKSVAILYTYLGHWPSSFIL